MALRCTPDCGESAGPERLAAEFGCRAALAGRCVRTMLWLLPDGHSLAVESFERWKSQVARVYDCDLGHRAKALARLAAAYGVPAERCEPAELLFVVQTYYALVVRLLVREATGGCGDDLLADDPLQWCMQIDHSGLATAVDEAMERMGCFATGLAGDQMVSRDWFKPLYQDLFPGSVRHAMGEYYTPRWLAEKVLDAVGYEGSPDCRLLDPSCGSGVFLLAAIDRVRRHAARRDGDLQRKILGSIAGFDLNPVAVLSARANYRIALGDLGGGLPGTAMPVSLRDCIRGERPCDDDRAKWDVVVGNPPWVTWDSLPQPYREATKPLWQQYGLFSLSGSDARHGGAKKDLAMLVVYAAADRYLRDGGRLGMVVTQTVLQNKGAGDGFRRFRLGDDGPTLRVLRVDDLSSFQPFADASGRTAVIALEKGRPTTYPVPYVRWSLVGKLPDPDRPAAGEAFDRQACRAAPIDPQQVSSPWLILPDGFAVSPAQLLGRSDYEAHLGANSGGANGVYWVEVLGAADGGLRVRNLSGRGKHDVAQVESVIEADLVYPLVRWADVDRYVARPRAHVLLTQDVRTRRGIDPEQMAQRYPRTLEYLKRFEPLLRSRSAYRRYQETAPYWSMYNVGAYTLAPHKVVWRRMDRRIRAAMVGPVDDSLLGVRPAVPQETCVLIAAASPEEAHYLCGVMNSTVVDFLVRAHSVCGGKSFGTPSVLQYLRVRRFEPSDERHVLLSEAARRAGETVHRRADGGEAQEEIDRLAGRLWGLSSQDVGALRGETVNCQDIGD